MDTRGGSWTGHFSLLTGEGRSGRDHHVAHSFGGWLKKPELFKMSTQEIQQSWTGDHSPSGTAVWKEDSDIGSEGELLCGEEDFVHCPVFDWLFFLCTRENPSLCACCHTCYGFLMWPLYGSKPGLTAGLPKSCTNITFQLP